MTMFFTENQVLCSQSEHRDRLDLPPLFVHFGLRLKDPHPAPKRTLYFKKAKKHIDIKGKYKEEMERVEFMIMLVYSSI